MPPKIGQIQLFPYDFAPRGWLPCEGAELLIFQNQALFKLLGKTFGGDGQRTFALPDMRKMNPPNCHYCIANEGDSSAELYKGIITETFLLPIPSLGAPNLLECAGQSLDIGGYTTLYNYLRETFGGEIPNFNLPKLSSEAINGYRYMITTEGTFPMSSRQAFIGELILLPIDPESPALQLCNGSKLPVDRNRDLFSEIGTRFGGDDRAFAVPNLSVAAPMNYNYYISKTGMHPSRP